MSQGASSDRPERLDLALARRGLAESREQARRLILAGRVRVSGQRVDKAAFRVDPAVAIKLESLPRFVSRGGDKLAGAFDAFALDVKERVCLDVGASTGGFTDCLLQHGAKRVIALDVGRGQMHWRLRQDARVMVMEGINARYLKPGDLPQTPSFATVDVSFISLRLILPVLVALLSPGADMICLIKPQFEAGREEVGRGGVVRDDAIRMRVVKDIRHYGCEGLGLAWHGCVPSPITGPKGNVEFLAWMGTQGA